MAEFAVKCGHVLFILLSRGRDAFGCTVRRRKKTVKLLVIREKTAIKRYFITDTVKNLYFKRSYMSFYCKYCEKITINNLIIHGEHVFLARQCIFKW